jgi:hypothetical protein
MDRITHQSPRQWGYGSTSSPSNDSLKHTRKHERRREESNQGTKQPGSGGPSGQEGRTVRTGHADCTACCRGLSAPAPRTVWLWAADCPKKQTEPPVATPNNGPSAGSTRTVRQAPADYPPGTRGPSETSPNQNSKSQRIESEAEQEHEEHATNIVPADRPPSPRRPSARHGQNQKLLDPESQHLQSITGSPKR